MRRPQRLALLALVIALAAAMLPLRARAAVDAASLQARVLAVELNDSRVGDWLVLLTPEGDLLARPQDLQAAGLNIATPGTLRLDGEDYLALSAVPGLQLELDERSQTVRLQADPSLFALRRIDARSVAALERPAGDSGFFNWALDHQHTAGIASTGVSAEAGLRLGPVLLQTSGARHGTATGFTRLMSQLSWDRPQQLQRWTAGDVVAIAPELGQGALLGGLSVASRFEMEPTLLRYPLGVLQGRALAASEVDIYVDGQRVRTERVQPGEFEIRDLLMQQGARSVQLVVRDAFGRSQTFDQSLYTSDQLLRPGLHEYQYAAGVLRQGYGMQSAAYGPPAYSAFHRVGLAPGLTAGLRAEGRPGLLNAGAQLTARLGEAAGVVSMALGASRSEAGEGRAVLLRYSYTAARWSASASMRRDASAYAGLSDDPARLGARQYDQLYASRQLGELGAVWLSVQRSLFDAAPGSGAAARQSRSASLGYAISRPQQRMSLRVGLAHVDDERGRRVEATLGLSFYLDSRSALHASTRADGHGSLQNLQYTRSVPAGEGWGAELAAEQAAGASAAGQWRATGQWNATHGVLSAETRGGQSADGQAQPSSWRLGASGALAWLGDRLHITRPLQESFALVRVGRLPDVPVSLNGTPAGRTDERGELLLPAIGAYTQAEVSLDPRALPLEAAVSTLRRRFMLAPRGGAVIDFPVTRLQAVLAQLVGPAGKAGNGRGPWALAQVKIHSPAALETFTGREGELYLENPAPGRHEGVARLDGRQCRFVLDVPARDDALIEAGPLACEESP